MKATRARNLPKKRLQLAAAATIGRRGQTAGVGGVDRAPPSGGGLQGNSWIRLILCGFITGVVWFLVSVVSLSGFAPDLVAFLQQSAPYSEWEGEFFFGVGVVIGVWARWLYSAIPLRYGAKPVTAAAT